jgi:putative phosphoserine phosphatase/1-acylglycerol-3-phosphate O-acyltransferase
MTRDEVVRIAKLSLDAAFGRRDHTAVLRATAQNWKGRLDEDIDALGERLYVQSISNKVVPHMRDLVVAHQRNGHTVVIASSATRYQVEPVARALGVENVLCSAIEVKNGVITGEIVQPVLWGNGKAHAVQEFAAARDVDLAHSFAYADGDEDAALLHMVGNPRATNPKPGLAKVAERRGWPVIEPRLTAALSTVQKLRNMAASAAFVPSGLTGAAVGVLTWNKRRGVNFAMAQWFDSMMLLDGIRLHVIGEQNLHAQRPAVFIFNHVNNFDPMVVSKLVRRDFTSVAKQELKASPMMRFAGEIGAVAFLDREDPRSAVAALKSITNKINDGISVIIAPEGTRGHDEGVGEFKKGAFRMAMQTGVPIVSIVVRNILDIADRDATMARPGHIDIAVLPPISVDRWTMSELPDRIAEVRQQFLDTLAHWPGSMSINTH